MVARLPLTANHDPWACPHVKWYSLGVRTGVRTFVIVACAVLTTGAVSEQDRPIPPLPPVGSRVPVSSYRVVRAYPHDPRAFTQGLEYDGGVMYEGTGMNGASVLRKVDLMTGRVLQEVSLAREYFGEGITLWGSNVLQLTYMSRIGFVYDRATFTRHRTFRYEGEGWGLTHDSDNIIMSDGTASLRFLNPSTLQEVRRLLVTDAGVPIKDLNELEYVRGEIYANVWQTDFIARISPATGRVIGWINLQGLLPPADRAGADVLNGIAYDSAGRRLFVTGKLWPKLFEISLIAAKASDRVK
jgi:glutaminyl-peptide cyclotransferase